MNWQDAISTRCANAWWGYIDYFIACRRRPDVWVSGWQGTLRKTATVFGIATHVEHKLRRITPSGEEHTSNFQAVGLMAGLRRTGEFAVEDARARRLEGAVGRSIEGW
jgi:hypothetical protein